MLEKTGSDPAQLGLFATPLDVLIAAEAEARVIAAFVDQLNSVVLGFRPINSMGRARTAGNNMKIFFFKNKQE
jgi:hypothetical protein